MRATLMRTALAGLTVILTAVILGETLPPAHAQGCQALWVERNSMYKRAGYCFKTQRAISYFGNAGCRFDNEAAVPLSRAQRTRIAAITKRERQLGCSD